MGFNQRLSVCASLSAVQCYLVTGGNKVWNINKRYVQFAVDNQALPLTTTNNTHLVIPVSGFYYVTLAAVFCEHPSHCCVAALYTNNEMLFKTPPLRSDVNECFLHNRAVLLPLQNNDVLFILLLKGSHTLQAFVVCFTG
jgi:hypothetical protein